MGPPEIGGIVLGHLGGESDGHSMPEQFSRPDNENRSAASDFAQAILQVVPVERLLLKKNSP
jgi:hypothetical protein